jgi:SAM-dependent methyltransferase
MGGAALFTSSAIFGATMPNAAHQWTQFYTGNAEMMYPAEAVIRIFKGSYPNLKMSKPKRGDKILDVGCGDGRHFELFSDLGMELAGTEITQDIVNSVAENLSAVGEIGIHPDLRVGTCAKLSWPNDSFNYLLTWNSCYYMGPDGKFEDHVAEMARVIKPGGWIVCSVPKSSCFIFESIHPVIPADGYVTIVHDHFGLRNGERMRFFRGAGELEVAFEPHFTNFCHADIDIDMFGLAYNWHVIVAQKT